MKADDIAKTICGEFEKISTKEEKDGYAGVIIIKNLLDNKSIEPNYLAKFHKIPVEFFNRAYDRLERSGIFLPYSWLYNNFALSKRDINRDKNYMIDWCYIAAKSSGYTL